MVLTLQYSISTKNWLLGIGVAPFRKSEDCRYIYDISLLMNIVPEIEKLQRQLE
jgi:hypothetical protein